MTKRTTLGRDLKADLRKNYILYLMVLPVVIFYIVFH